MREVFSYLKNNLWVVLLILIIGNSYYFFNKKKETDHYRGTIKFRHKSIVYDRMGFILAHFTSDLQKKNPDCQLTYRSIRNEENYIYEVYIDALDSSRIFKLAPEIISLVKSDSIIRMHYYQKLDDISAIINSQLEFLVISNKMKSENISSEINYDVEYKERVAQINIFNLTNMKLSLYKDFEIYPFNSSSIVFIHTTFMAELLKINLILFVLGIFAIVILRQFRK